MNWKKTVPYVFWVSSGKAGVDILVCVALCLYSFFLLQPNFSPSTKVQLSPWYTRFFWKGRGREKEGKAPIMSILSPTCLYGKGFSHFYTPTSILQSARTWSVVGRHLTVISFPEEKASLKTSKELKRKKQSPIGRTRKAHPES